MISEMFSSLSDSEIQVRGFPGAQHGAAPRAVQGQGARAELGIAAPAKPTGTFHQGLRSDPTSLDVLPWNPGINTVLGEQPH